MSTMAPSPTRTSPGGTERPRARRRPKRKGTLLRTYTWAVLAWMFLPILVMAVFGFNDTTSRYNFRWQGFTLRWWENVFAIPNLTEALVNSFTIAVIVTIVAVLLGTPMGMALGRYRYRGRGFTDLVLFANIAAPEIGLGAALLSLYLTIGIPRGYWTIVIAHVMFTIPFVAITVRARMAGLDTSLEEAARDLGSGPFTTFRLVTLPLIVPGVLAGGLLAFALSIDDFIITQFTAGQTLTFPLWVWGASRLGVPPQADVMGTIIFLVGVLLAVLGGVAAKRRD
ncbi:MAG TPA: ABC transporter permease [Segeticoccus sp.]|uniref:ABC transporter permease n=1 Tax=Segeticoccus sp. TaxID=2706531 RepID=UPI002D7F3DB8|nr:ABC transporter permease [Segeticoccus sp.]HET8599070.1 ABC transporter permease [Segeticoccus sp.]